MDGLDGFVQVGDGVSIPKSGGSIGLNHVTLAVIKAPAVPELSSVLLGGLGAVTFVLRRKRA